MLAATGVGDAPGRFRLITMRSNDQFNTTIYGFSDRLRGIEGRRDVLLINPGEMRRAGLVEGQRVALESDAEDDTRRVVENLVGDAFRAPGWLPRGLLPGGQSARSALVPRHPVEDAGIEGGAGAKSAPEPRWAGPCRRDGRNRVR